MRVVIYNGNSTNTLTSYNDVETVTLQKNGGATIAYRTASANLNELHQVNIKPSNNRIEVMRSYND